MSILQRYVLRELAGPLAMGLGVFTFVFLIGQLFKITDLLLNSGVSPLLAGELIASLLPGILAITIPMALLVAILLAVGRLAADREILAIRMSGVNLMHIVLPIIVVAAILTGLLMQGNQRLVPYLNLKTSDLTTQIFFNMLSAIPPDRPKELETDREGMQSVFFYDERVEETGEMRGVNIRTLMEKPITEKDKALLSARRKKLQELGKKKDEASKAEIKRIRAEMEYEEQNRAMQETLITAHSGEITADIKERLISLNLTSGSMHVMNPDKPEAYDIIQFAGFSKAIRPAFRRTELGVYKKQPREMSVTELRKQMREARKPRPFFVEYYQRLSIPLACIAFALIAIPLAVYVRPTGKAIAFAISFLLILLYYGFLNYGISLGNSGNKFAPFAIFFPNILLSTVGGFLLYRMVMK